MVATLDDAPPVSAPRPLLTLQPGLTQAQVMRTLLEAGVHFGHQTKRWNPKMRPYIFTERNGIHILDLAQTVAGLNSAVEFVEEIAAQGGRLLMVGTKKQAQDVIAEEARRSGQFYVNKRWPGGLLTNFVTIRQRLRYLADLEARQARGEIEQLPKQEAKKLGEEMFKLNEVLGGIKNMYDLPSAMFVVDTHKERIAMAEALRLEIPVIAINDTNSDPDEVDYVIPGNDDAIRSVKIITARLSEAFIEGVNRREALRAEQMMSEQESRASRGDDRGERRDDRGGRGERGGRDRNDRGGGGGRDRNDRGDRGSQPRGEQRNDQPRNDQPRNDQPRSDQARNDQPRGDQPRNDQPRSDQPRGDQSRGDQPRNDQRVQQPRSEQPRNEQRPEQSRGGQPRSDQQRSDQQRTEQPRSEQRPEQPAPTATASS